MPTDFSSIVSAPASGRTTAVVIDHQHYAQAVLLRGQPIPWSDPVSYASFLRQAQGLLRPDVTLLDLGAWYRSALAADSALAAKMSARTRTGYALKTLLADGPTTTSAIELAGIVAETSATPLVLQIPSPLRWLALTHESTGAGSITDLDVGNAENAAMYIADWLRRLSDLPVAMLLLDERWAGDHHRPHVESSAYTPVQNIAKHYRWTLARRTTTCVEILGSTVTGTVIEREFWLADPPPARPTGDFLLAEIPAEAVPETVLLRLANLS